MPDLNTIQGTKVLFTRSEYDGCLDWLTWMEDEKNKNPKHYRCGDDGWIPKQADFDQITALYYMTARDLLMEKEKRVNKMKAILVFMMWIVGSSQDISLSIENKIQKFLKDHIIIVDDPRSRNVAKKE